MSGTVGGLVRVRLRARVPRECACESERVRTAEGERACACQLPRLMPQVLKHRFADVRFVQFLRKERRTARDATLEEMAGSLAGNSARYLSGSLAGNSARNLAGNSASKSAGRESGGSARGLVRDADGALAGEIVGTMAAQDAVCCATALSVCEADSNGEECARLSAVSYTHLRAHETDSYL
eukprot:5296843-Pleurochrysis_carterae.AAC.1